MAPEIFFRDDGPEALISVLSEHLPGSLPLLRRLQFMNIKGGRTETSHILASFKRDPGRCFVAAYLDYSRGPETEIWIFSSLEKGEHTVEEFTLCEDQIMALFRLCRDIEKNCTFDRETPGIVLVGSLHETVLDVLREKKLVQMATGPHYKYIFEESRLPACRPLPSGDLSWSTIQPTNIPLVLSRTEIPRKERTMLLLPSIAVSSKATTEPIAWAFLGPDGSITSLHCEKDYRGQGLAKAVTVRLHREQLKAFSTDGLGHADVSTQNLQSQGVCMSLGGQVVSQVYWAWIQISEL